MNRETMRKSQYFQVIRFIAAVVDFVCKRVIGASLCLKSRA